MNAHLKGAAGLHGGLNLASNVFKQIKFMHGRLVICNANQHGY